MAQTLPGLRGFKVPRNISGARALEMALAMTGCVRETELVRYLALSLHYVSWTLPDESTLLDYAEVLNSLNGLDAKSSVSLLHLMSFELTYTLRGEHDNLPFSLVQAAQEIAAQGRQFLAAREIDVLRLHHRMLGLFEDILRAPGSDQEMLTAELHHVLLRTSDVTSPQTAGQQGPYLEGGPLQLSSPEDALEKHRALLQISSLGAECAMLDTDAHVKVIPLLGAQALSGRRVFEPDEAFAVLQSLPPPSPHEGNNQQRSVLEALARDTGWRSMTEVALEDPLPGLYARFPHFKVVLDVVARALALAACGSAGRPVQVAPLLLRGVPGTGKTYFAQELAKALGTHFLERDLSVISEAFVLAGMDPSWKGSKPGIVFEALVNGKTANPLICLNEVDKSKVSDVHNSPMAPLYALLEPTSAEQFRDEYLPVTLDASNIIWVLTANDGFIPEPILSRLEVFDIARPNQEQCRAVARSVWGAICQKTLPPGHGFALELADELVTLVSALSPREMRRTLTRAVGEAAFCGRKQLMRSDMEGACRSFTAPVRSIGFIA